MHGKLSLLGLLLQGHDRVFYRGPFSIFVLISYSAGSSPVVGPGLPHGQELRAGNGIYSVSSFRRIQGGGPWSHHFQTHSPDETLHLLFLRCAKKKSKRISEREESIHRLGSAAEKELGFREDLVEGCPSELELSI